jgi:hypothetical protein
MGVLGEAYGYALTAPLDELKDSASVRGRTRRRTQSLQGVGSEQPAPEFIPDSAAAHRALVKEKQGKVTELQLKSEELAKSQSLVEADIAALRVIWQAARAEDLEDRPNVEHAAKQLEAAQSQIRTHRHQHRHRVPQCSADGTRLAVQLDDSRAAWHPLCCRLTIAAHCLCSAP